MDESSIKYASCYSNGIYGNRWAVRQVTREHADGSVSYKNVAGPERRKSATMARDAFANWAKYEVVLKENEWVKLTPDRYREPE